MKLSIAEQISHSTIRITCITSDGSIKTGTGFFFNFQEDEVTNSRIPVIITNKHVIEGAILGKVLFTKADQNGDPLDKEHLTVDIPDLQSQCIRHLDPNVDLCAIPIGEIVHLAREQNVTLFYKSLNKQIIPTEEVIATFSGFENIMMVGYPNGLWDHQNNKPIFRRGSTATHIRTDYCGKKEFMIDAACFPGSSGSPVFLFDQGTYTDRTGGTIVGHRLFLLGVLHAGPQISETGSIEVVDIPTASTLVTKVDMMLNLGYVIKAERILELEQLFKDM